MKTEQMVKDLTPVLGLVNAVGLVTVLSKLRGTLEERFTGREVVLEALRALVELETPERAEFRRCVPCGGVVTHDPVGPLDGVWVVGEGSDGWPALEFFHFGCADPLRLTDIQLVKWINHQTMYMRSAEGRSAARERRIGDLLVPTETGVPERPSGAENGGLCVHPYLDVDIMGRCRCGYLFSLKY